MFTRALTLLAAAWLLAAAAFVTGCQQDEARTHRHIEIQDQVVEQHEVVE